MTIDLGLKNNQNLLCSFPVKNDKSLQGELKFLWGKLIELDYTADYFPQLDLDENFVLEVQVNNIEKMFLQSFKHGGTNFRSAFTGAANPQSIQKISFYTSDLSGVFSFDIANSKYLDEHGYLKLKFEPIEASFSSEFGHVLLTMGLAYSSQHNLGNICLDYQIVITLAFESLLSINDVDKLMYQLKQFFSTFTAHNFTFDEITIRDDKDKLGNLYIATNDEDYEILERHKHILDTQTFRSQIDTCLKNFFHINNFEFQHIWSRVPPLLQLKHLLEYEVLIFGSILDKYVKHKCKDVIEDDWSFRRCYKTFTQDNELKKWLLPFFDDDAFNKVLDIRDRAAHGEIEKLSGVEVNYFLGKLKVLIFFLMYRDLGFSEQKTISLFFNNGHAHSHPIIRECRFDSYKVNLLHPKAQQIKEIQVKKGESLKLLNEKTLKKDTRYLTFLKEKSSGGYDVYTLLPEQSDRLLTRFMKERHYWKHIRHLKDMVWLMLPENLKRGNDVSYVKSLYIKTEKNQKPVLIQECFIIEKESVL